MDTMKLKPGKIVAVRYTAKAKSTAELVMYGRIGSSWYEEGITAQTVSDALKSLEPTVTEITIRLFSEGGDVFEGIAIYNRIKQFKGKKTIIVDALSASIASVIMLAADKRIMSEGSMVMIHLPWTMTMGNRNDIENTVNRLQDVEEEMLRIYQRATGRDKNEIRAMLEKETWMNAETAIEMGFADELSEDQSLPIAASVMNREWIHSAPKNYKSVASIGAAKKLELQKKFEAYKAARK